MKYSRDRFVGLPAATHINLVWSNKLAMLFIECRLLDFDRGAFGRRTEARAIPSKYVIRPNPPQSLDCTACQGINRLWQVHRRPWPARLGLPESDLESSSHIATGWHGQMEQCRYEEVFDAWPWWTCLRTRVVGDSIRHDNIWSRVCFIRTWGKQQEWPGVTVHLGWNVRGMDNVHKCVRLV